MPERDALPLVRPAVLNVLERSPAFRQLSSDKQRDIAQDTATVAGYLAAPEGIPANTLCGAVIVVPPDGLREAVDFPTFAAGLIEGVFAAVVDASIQQMDAYAKLLKEAARIVDRFHKDNGADDDGARPSAERRRIAATRQQQLSTMVLLGINRIVVTDRRTTVDMPPA